MSFTTIATDNAPQAIGPYAQAIRAGNIVYCSGQIPIDPSTGIVELFGGDIGKQTTLVLKNLSAVIAAAGGTLQQVVKTTVYLKEMNDFPAMNAAYAAAFGTHKAARATVQVARLPKDVSVEIDAIVVLDPPPLYVSAGCVAEGGAGGGRSRSQSALRRAIIQPLPKRKSSAKLMALPPAVSAMRLQPPPLSPPTGGNKVTPGSVSHASPCLSPSASS